MNKQFIPDQAKYCDSMCFYLNHIKLGLSFGRLEFLRHYADHIGALMSGYVTMGGVYKGNYDKAKQSCYASNAALALLQKNQWSMVGLHMEHVVPIKVIGNVLWTQHKENKHPLTCQEILDVLKHLLIPCLITNPENKLFAANGLKLSRAMPKGWIYDPAINNQWARYTSITSSVSTQATLFSDIVALAPPIWMNKAGFPLPPSPPVAPPWAPTPTSPYNCFNSSGYASPNGCLQGNNSAGSLLI